MPGKVLLSARDAQSAQRKLANDIIAEKTQVVGSKGSKSGSSSSSSSRKRLSDDVR